MFNIVRNAETGVQHFHFTSTFSAFANENSFFHSTLACGHTNSQIDYSLTVSNGLALTMSQSEVSLFKPVMLIFCTFAEIVFTLSLFLALHTL